MGNSTTFLTLPAHQLLGTQIVYAEKKVNFALESVASGSTIDVLNIPKGAIPLQAGFYSNTHQDTVTYALSIPTRSITLVSATAHTADDELTMNSAGLATNDFTTQMVNAVDTLRVTIGAATASTAVVTFFIIYAISDERRN